MNEYKDYCFCSDWDGDGEIYNLDRQIVWRFQTTGLKGRSSESGSVRRPVFIFCGSDGKELLAIYRERRFPLARFTIMENDSPVCGIWQRNLLFTRYEFRFANGPKWNLYLPMFTVFIKGVSDAGAEILARFPSRRQWYVRIGTGFDTPAMMAALAYVIRKKLQRT